MPPHYPTDDYMHHYLIHIEEEDMFTPKELEQYLQERVGRWDEQEARPREEEEDLSLLRQ